VAHSPFANSLQRIGKHTAFAFGECTGECISLAKWQMHSPIIRPMPLKLAESHLGVTLNFNSKKNIFYSRITILLALAILVTAPPSNHPHLPMADSRVAAPPHSSPLKWRFRRSAADPTTLSSEALELLTKRHFYEQQKTRYPCYKTFYVGKLKYFTIASLYFWRMRRICQKGRR
jgi:hypothetical protein